MYMIYLKEAKEVLVSGSLVAGLMNFDKLLKQKHINKCYYN